MPTAIPGKGNLPRSLASRLRKATDINLLPGELIITREPKLVRTLLGSCLAVVMHDAQLEIGAICHAQLAQRNDKARCSERCPVRCLKDSPEDNPFKYVTCSIEHMLKELAKLGSRPQRLTIKLFGGAMMFGTGTRRRIGQENIHAARSLLQQKGLLVENEDLGGTNGRTVYFQTDTGEIFLKKGDGVNKR